MENNYLIVDDSAIIRKLIKKALNMSELAIGNISEAENGAIALEKLEENKVDIIFLDINMPVMTGIEFMKHFRQTPHKEKSKVVVVSTEGSNTRFDALKKLGIYAQLRKPVQPEVLIDTVKEILDGK